MKALNATVNCAEGTVTGLIKTNVCAEGGDSGGSLFAVGKALGLTSGGNGNCLLGGTTYLQPTIRPLCEDWRLVSDQRDAAAHADCSPIRARPVG